MCLKNRLPTKSQPLQILLIEDDEEDYFLLNDTLVSHPQLDFELTWVRTYQQGLSYMLEKNPDVALIDVYLGPDRGVDLIQAATDKGTQVPMIILTGKENAELDQQAMEAGADAYLLKDNLSSNHLERVIRYARERRRQNQAFEKLNSDLEGLNAELEQRVNERTQELMLINYALHEREARSRLLKEIAITSQSVENMGQMFTKILPLFAYYTDWPIAHCYFYEHQRFAHSPEACFISDQQRYQGLCPHQQTFAVNKLLIQAFQTGEVIYYTPEPATEEPQYRQAYELGLQSVILIPLKVREQVVAVMEFFALSGHAATQTLAELIEETQQQIQLTLERIQAQSDLRNSEKRLSQAMAMAKMCSFVWDLQQDQITWSQEALRLFSVPFDLPSNQQQMWEMTHPKDRERVKKAWLTAIKNKKTYRIDHQVLLANEHTEHIHILGEIELDQDHTVWRMVGTVQNINDRKQVELDLAKMKSAAEAANKAKSAFLASMSHEIRTPMNAILGFTQVLLRDHSIQGPQRQQVETIAKSGQHLLNLINDVLEISKIEAGRIQLHQESFNLPELLQEVHQLFSETALRQKLQFVLHCPENMPQWILGDKVKIRQILLNLLSNAFKFTRQGKVELRAAWRLGQLTLMVEDTGMGIAPEELTKVFQSFEQTSSGLQSQTGTGLGMSISKTYAQMMNGDLTVSSIPGVGSCFTLEICVELSEATSALPPDKNDRYLEVYGLAAGQPEWKILAADDREENRELLRLILEPIGFQVQLVKNGKEALDLAHSWRPHLMLMDANMPEVNGLEAARQWRQHEQTSTNSPLPIVFVTASAFDSERREILAAGADAVLTKPLSRETLLQTLENLLPVEYFYFTEAVSNPTSPLNLSKLDGELSQQLQDALKSGDLELFGEILQQVPDLDSRVELQHLANQFDFERLFSLLGVTS